MSLDLPESIYRKYWKPLQLWRGFLCLDTTEKTYHLVITINSVLIDWRNVFSSKNPWSDIDCVDLAIPSDLVAVCLAEETIGRCCSLQCEPPVFSERDQPDI